MRYIKQYHPIHIHGFSPSEVDFFAKLFRLDARDVIRELRAAGLDSIPGGGGEILVQRVRDIAAPKKAGADRWLEIMELAHEQGMKTSVTMMYGIGETLAERIEHLERVRDVQSRTSGFTAAICWPLPPEYTPEPGHMPKPDAVAYLRPAAIPRTVPHNVRRLPSQPRIRRTAPRLTRWSGSSSMPDSRRLGAARITPSSCPRALRRDRLGSHASGARPRRLEIR